MTEKAKTTKTTKATQTERAKPTTIKLPLGSVTFDIDGFTYKYQPQPDISVKELNDMMLMLVTVATTPANWDVSTWLKNNNLLRHFIKV